MAVVDAAAVESLLGRVLCPAESGALEGLIGSATATLANVGCNEFVENHTVEIRPSSCTSTVRVFGPLVEVQTIEINSEPLTGFTWAPDGSICLGVCVCPGDVVTIECSHGYDPIPADISGDLAARFAAMFRASSIATSAAAGGAGQMVTQKTIGATSVSYATPSADVLEFLATAGTRFLRFTPDELRTLRRRFGRTATTTRT